MHLRRPPVVEPCGAKPRVNAGCGCCEQEDGACQKPQGHTDPHFLRFEAVQDDWSTRPPRAVRMTYHVAWTCSGAGEACGQSPLPEHPEHPLEGD